MPPVRSIKNQYRGVNAHLHSLWQGMGGWSRFHTNHITDLMRFMRPLLLPMGYDADVEPSLQIRRLDDVQPTQYPESDVTIYDLSPSRPRRTGTSIGERGELVLPLPDALYGERLSEKEYSAIKIYEQKGGKLDRGEPVAWVELLSPSNKPGGRDAQEYFDKRLTVLENGIVFVEIDYLHESAPTMYRIPNYRRRRGTSGDEEAKAYRVIMIDPRPTIDEGIVRVNAFGVDDPFPIINIPLNADDTFQLDLGVPYRKTFEETLYGQQLVDYSQIPLHFDRYSKADQARIANRMLAVVEAARAGRDLEAAPFPVEGFSLEAALDALKG